MSNILTNGSRFIHFYGEVYDKEKEDLGVTKSERITIDIYIEKSSVIAVRECIADEGDDVHGSMIYLLSGENFWVEDIAEVAMQRLGILYQKNERTAFS